MQDEFNKAKQTFECDPTNKNASDSNTRALKGEEGGTSPTPSPFFFEISLPSAQIPFPIAEFGKNPSATRTTSFRFASEKLWLNPTKTQKFTRIYKDVLKTRGSL